MLAEDITLVADGGGKAAGAAKKPVHGADHVARFVIGVTRKVGAAATERRSAEINGQPGYIAYLAGRPVAALVFDIRDSRIHGIYVVSNPDKLQRFAAH